MESVLLVVLVLGLLNLLIFFTLIWLVFKTGKPQDNGIAQVTAAVAAGNDRLERELRGEVAGTAQRNRQELLNTFSQFTSNLIAQQGETVRSQNNQLDVLGQQLASLQKGLTDSLATQHKSVTDTLILQLRALTEGNDLRSVELRQTVDQRLRELQGDNEKKLEQMRQTVDEKLHATLELRLGESFKQVAERLELVHRGLGEMQGLAQGVGDLKHLLSNVKTRGIFGEAQLGALLEQVLSPEQYAVQVATKPDSREVVDFAIKLPGKNADGAPCWLPIDAKFPNEDYARLLDAQERADAPAAELAARGLEARIKLEAKSIAAKYVSPPHTTDFAILFLPSEGLYAEALRRSGLMESLQRDYRVTLAGPTTLLAMLSSLQMGFRTLALEKRSSEVWQVLGAVKTEFGKFGDVLARTKKKLEEAQNTIGDAETRTRAIGRKLRDVEALTDEKSSSLLADEIESPVAING
jgi:DNA recombination protein RmuC